MSVEKVPERIGKLELVPTETGEVLSDYQKEGLARFRIPPDLDNGNYTFVLTPFSDNFKPKYIWTRGIWILVSSGKQPHPKKKFIALDQSRPLKGISFEVGREFAWNTGAPGSVLRIEKLTPIE